jgi:Flp pilus assembly protein TadB
MQQPQGRGAHPTNGFSQETRDSGSLEDSGQKEKSTMLWTLFVILLIAWLIGLIGFHVVAWYIHILLVLALVVLVIQLISGRRTVV